MRLALLTALLLSLVGCSSCRWEEPVHPEAFLQPRIVDDGRYELQVGDVLEFVYTIGPQQPTAVGDYTINVGDELRVEFAWTEEFNRDVTVRPDGKVTLPIIGEALAYGMTPTELSQSLQGAYSEHLLDPVITVDVPQYTSLTQQVARAIITPQGTTRTFVYPVRPDGRITLVAVGDVPAFGRTVPELSNAITEAYAGIGHPEIQVTPILTETGAQQVYLLGEVRQPGIYEMNGDIDVRQAVSMAGGFTDRANRRSVIILRRLEDGTIEGFRTDLIGEIRDNEFVMNYLRPYDVVYVPREHIANINVLIEQYLTRGLYGVTETPVDWYFTNELINRP